MNIYPPLLAAPKSDEGGFSPARPRRRSTLDFGLWTLDSAPATLRFSQTARAFTLIEIAISLGVIGFALVAIIGVLPMAMNVQKDNRQETIINQDASVFLDAIRNGERGLNDLTNYVYAITNFSTRYAGGHGGSGTLTVYAYTYNGSWINGSAGNLPINNGVRIVGLLSTPRYTDFVPAASPQFTSNYVIASVRSMSGMAGEKAPQAIDPNGLAFTYRLTSEIAPYSDFSPAWTNYTDPKISAQEKTNRLQYSMVMSNLQHNLHDVRLIFRWPLFQNGDVGNKRQIFRTMVSGSLLGPTNENGLPAGVSNLYYFQSRTYVKAP
jgi:type II secretory pathway pseudopilin PulG